MNQLLIWFCYTDEKTWHSYVCDRYTVFKFKTFYKISVNSPVSNLCIYSRYSLVWLSDSPKSLALSQGVRTSDLGSSKNRARYSQNGTPENKTKRLFMDSSRAYARSFSRDPRADVTNLLTNLDVELSCKWYKRWLFSPFYLFAFLHTRYCNPFINRFFRGLNLSMLFQPENKASSTRR